MDFKPNQRILVLTNCLRSESKTLSHAIELAKLVDQYRFFQFNFKDKKSSSEKVKELTTYNFEARLSSNLNYSKYFEREAIDIYCIKRTLFNFKTFFENEKHYLFKTLLNTEKPILVFPN